MEYLHIVAMSLAVTLVFTQNDGAMELGNSNFEATIKNTELVIVNFYAKWCKFSRMLEPIFDDTAKAVVASYPEVTSVRLGKVDCEREGDVARRYNINKYPTIKIFKVGKVQKREYRGSRSKEAIVEYVRKQMESPIKEIKDLDDIQDVLDAKKHNVIGYFENNEMNEYKQFDKVASMLRDDCGWFAAFGDVSSSQRPTGGFQIVYKPPNSQHNEKIYSSNLRTHELFLSWAQDKCIPLVRTITFENAEELTEEGIPFLILFHHPEDTESPKKFTDVVHKHLIKEKDSITFLTADGVQFAHPLHHMGKGVKDLPVLSIDSFKHMYVFPDKNTMFDHTALLQFIQDLHSGKLHREFHHGPDRIAPPKPPQEDKKRVNVPPQATTKIPASSTDGKRTQPPPVDTKHPPKTDQPPESQFAKLAPSDLRYSFKYKDEL